jgi:hypothetical protein
MAFVKAGTLQPNGAPVLRSDIVANSVALTVEDSVKLASGFIALGTAGAAVYGHVAGIVTRQGVGLNTDGTAGAAMGSFVNAYTMSSSNQTVAKVKAIVDVSQMSMYTNPTGGTLGTTTGSNLLGYNLDLSSEDTLDETTAATTSAQYFNWGVSPTNTSLIVVTIHESVL